MPLNDNRPAKLRYFKAYKRTVTGQQFFLGIVSADCKTTADTRARYLYGRLLATGEAVWCEEPEDADQAA